HRPAARVLDDDGHPDLVPRSVPLPCKGLSDCGTTVSACKGQNACKGQGFLYLSQSDCAKANGEFVG
ncbi:MAG: hypothetical protein AAF420_00585, partial [Pseudomonadota bacterium]